MQTNRDYFTKLFQVEHWLPKVKRLRGKKQKDHQDQAPVLFAIQMQQIKIFFVLDLLETHTVFVVAKKSP